MGTTMKVAVLLSLLTSRSNQRSRHRTLLSYDQRQASASLPALQSFSQNKPPPSSPFCQVSKAQSQRQVYDWGLSQPRSPLGELQLDPTLSAKGCLRRPELINPSGIRQSGASRPSSFAVSISTLWFPATSMEMPRNNDILTDKLLWACNSSFSQLTQNLKKACYRRRAGGGETPTLSEGQRDTISSK